MRIILNSARWQGALLTMVASVCAGGLSACSTPAPGSNGVRVVAAENVWGDIARQVAGHDAAVRSVVTQPDADPHDYEPTPQDARDFADASLVIENGAGYDPWAQRLLDADPVGGRVVLDVGRVVGVPDGGNPHQWYSRAAVATFVRQLASDLGRVDPSHKAAYAQRAAAFESTLAPYDDVVARMHSTFGGTAIGASESLVAPWADTLGLRLSTPETFVNAVSEGSEPAVSDKATVDRQIRDREIKAFVFNRQNSTPDVQRLVDAARAARIPVVTVTETISPADATFQQWQLSEVRALYAALENGADR